MLDFLSTDTPIRRLVVAVCGIITRRNVVNQASALCRHGPGRRQDRGSALKTDDVNSDVVVVVDDVVRDAKIRDVPIYYKRLARTGLKVVHPHSHQ
jgi:hypothetical protein